MEYHYKFNDKIYINTDHMDEINEYLIEYLEHKELYSQLDLREDYDICQYEEVKDLKNTYFKCPVCGSNRFSSYGENNETLTCSNSTSSYLYRYGKEVIACPGFKINRKEWEIIKERLLNE